MADISGLQMAFQAWKSVTDGKEQTLPGVKLNAQQLFFLNAAQVQYISGNSNNGFLNYSSIVLIKFFFPRLIVPCCPLQTTSF